jgi:hypothetical protein
LTKWEIYIIIYVQFADNWIEQIRGRSPSCHEVEDVEGDGKPERGLRE